MESQIVTHEGFFVIGIAIQTQYDGPDADAGIPELWEQFFAEGIQDKIPNKEEDYSLVGVYTDYDEQDDTYTFIAGVTVNSLENIPAGMRGHEVPEGMYARVTNTGELFEAVQEAWEYIWSDEFEDERIFTTDFEWYDERCADPENAEIDVFVAIE